MTTSNLLHRSLYFRIFLFALSRSPLLAISNALAFQNTKANPNVFHELMSESSELGRDSFELVVVVVVPVLEEVVELALEEEDPLEEEEELVEEEGEEEEGLLLLLELLRSQLPEDDLLCVDLVVPFGRPSASSCRGA